jgi:hypothetical protein
MSVWSTIGLTTRTCMKLLKINTNMKKANVIYILACDMNEISGGFKQRNGTTIFFLM